MDRMETLTKAMWNIDESLIQNGLDADEELGKATEVSLLKMIKHKNHLKKMLIWAAALMILLLLGGTTVYAILYFRGEVRKSENTLSFSLDSKNYRIDEDQVKGQILEAKDVTKKQYEQWTVLDGDLPGHYYKEFSEAEEAEAYVGYEKLMLPRMKELAEASVRVDAYVSDTQKFETVIVSVSYAEFEGVLPTEYAWIWTKDCSEEPGVTMEGQRIIDHINDERREANGREFLIVTLKNPSESDYVNRTVYWAEDTVLYGLSLRYTDSEEHEAEAERLMLQWMNSF